MNQVLNEVKLARVWQYFTDDNRVAAIITAFRGEHDFETNMKRNASLAGELRNLGYGIVFVDGYWIENSGTPEEVHVAEKSILVSASIKNTQEFAKNIHNLGNKYSQEAVVVKDDKGTRLVFKDGSTDELGDIKPGQMSDIYTRLHTNKKASTFIFEGEHDDLGWFQRLAGIKK
jgi:hypothetical protein